MSAEDVVEVRAPIYRGEGVNEYGTPVSLFTCAWCGDDFSICPAADEERRSDWDGCLAESCESYNPSRDADLYFSLGMVTKDGDPDDDPR